MKHLPQWKRTDKFTQVKKEETKIEGNKKNPDFEPKFEDDEFSKYSF